jgi:hypothetical protein
MFILLWFVTIVISYFIGRQIVKVSGNEFDGELGIVVGFLLIGLAPFLNVIIYLIVWGICAYEENGMDEIGILRKIFRIKDDKK